MNYDRKVWKGLIKLWKEEPHCFILGCGKETLTNWYKKVNGYDICSKKLRKSIENAVIAGVVISYRNSSSGNTCYLFERIRKNLLLPEIKRYIELGAYAYKAVEDYLK